MIVDQTYKLKIPPYPLDVVISFTQSKKLFKEEIKSLPYNGSFFIHHYPGDILLFYISKDPTKDGFTFLKTLRVCPCDIGRCAPALFLGHC